ncbi:hypothetical protein BJY22_000458 [Kribbella shirazensis]|uniref:Uncharacterized protein n=1 Tax=Kribbella shirazensis TaxID=1105143 RepID=A0A7X5ZY63_9ACTN|nr:hypothetical protein [Kribbella shirazensis]
MAATDSSASPSSGAIWLEFGLTVGAMFGARLLAGTVHGAPSSVLRAVAGLLLIALLLRSSRLGERVARRKGIYHPQYFVLGPIGLVMALVARRRLNGE